MKQKLFRDGEGQITWDGCQWRPWFKLVVSELATLTCFFSLFFHSEFIIHVTYVIHQRSFVHGGEAKNRHGNGLQWKKAWVTGWNLCLLDPFSSVFDLWLNLGMMNFEKKTIWRLSFPRNQIILWMVVIHLPLFEHMCIFVCVRVRLHWMRADGRCKLQPESRHFCWSNLGSMAIPGS